MAAALIMTVFVAGCSATPRVPEPSNLPQETTSAYVYFATGRSLVEEQRVVDATNVYRSTLDQLLAAQPRVNTGIAIVQPTAKVRSVSLANRVITVDWSGDVLEFDAEPGEKRVALAAFLRTFGQFPEVDRVRFTVEGRTDGTVGSKNIQAFWGAVSLKGQPWPVIRPSGSASGAAASSAGSSRTP